MTSNYLCSTYGSCVEGQGQNNQTGCMTQCISYMFGVGGA